MGDCYELLVRLLMMRPKPTSEEGGAKPNFRRRRGGLNVKFGVGGVSPTVIDDFTVRADCFLAPCPTWDLQALVSLRW